MKVTIGPYEFEHFSYDAFGDILYLRRRAGQGGVGEDTPEGHAWLYPVDAPGSDEVVGLDLHNPRLLLEREGEVAVTLPGGERVRAEVAGLVGAPAGR